MKVFIIGISGATGGLLVEKLQLRGDSVEGLVRRPALQESLAAMGVASTVGDLETMEPREFAKAVSGADAIVYAAGSDGGALRVTKSVDGDGVITAIEGATLAGVKRFILISVFPEAGRALNLGEEFEYYYLVKKTAEVSVTRSVLDWVIVRPTLLVDGSGRGAVSLGAAELQGQVAREDLAASLVGLLHESRISRQILELSSGDTAIADAVDRTARD
ncbi:NAD(P)H-binding protein [Aeromicrobium sp. P5_D10]